MGEILTFIYIYSNIVLNYIGADIGTKLGSTFKRVLTCLTRSRWSMWPYVAFFCILLVSVWYPFWYPVIPELCATQEWGVWTPCSKSCGSSVKKRSRAIKIPKAGKLGNQKNNNFKKKGQRALSFFFWPKRKFRMCKNYMRHSENLEYCCHLVKQAWFVSSTLKYLKLNSICQLCLDKNLAESTMYWGQDDYPRRSRCQANGGKDCVGVADDERPVAMKVYRSAHFVGGKQQYFSLKSGALLATELAIGSNLIQHWPCIVLISWYIMF